MCSIDDDVLETAPVQVMITEEKTILTDKCNKCRTERPCITLRSKDSYCENCFLAGVTHKFKALLGKSRLIRPNDCVLISHKTGHPSSALLHFLRCGLDLNTPKKLRFKPIILFIEDQYQLCEAERQVILGKVHQEIKSFGFNPYYISFSEYVLDPNRISEILTCNKLSTYENDKEKLWTFLDKKTSKTNRTYIINLLERQLLIDVAKHLECKFVFSPEISIDTASNLLTHMCLGRGSHVSIDTGFCDDRDEKVKILRPLRLFDMKELTLYNKLNGTEPVFVQQQEVNPYSSVQDLLKKFVGDLQGNFPATITTVLKTGDKLSCYRDETQICKMCKGALQKKHDQLTSEESTHFSHLVSTETPDYSVTRQERYKHMLEKFENKIVNNKEYCYACSKISDCIVKS